MIAAASVSTAPDEKFPPTSTTTDLGGATIERIPAKRVLNVSSLPWHDRFVSRVEKLIRLPRGWNGYGAGPVSFHCANFAMSLISSACPHDVHEPQVVPGINGDLQIEWHSLEYDIEIHIRAPFDVVATRYGPNDLCEEMALSNEFTVVAEWLNELENAVAARATAA
ncbi:hypothetical protein JNB71_03400 [Rhizobium herbae]|uniref:Uncharacterized protein n=1 Tax=Rhizobium herbae TaxID=508661 RepID=A0ABS7H757_9HYPH|nr:hypothetical protein [Rhizobium herbae]MBW9062357.1 hypothetical protein [Rhizobium herbae]